MNGALPLDDARRRLEGTALAELPRTAVMLPGGGASTWVIDLGDAELVSSWREARRALAGSGFCPVAVANWDATDWDKADLFSRFFYGKGADPAPASVIERSNELSVTEALARFARHDEWFAKNWTVVVESEAAATERRRGVAPDASLWSDIRAGDLVELERRLLAWEETVSPSDSSQTIRSFAWFDPRPHHRVGLVLLPVSEPWAAGAYLSFYGAEGDGRHEALIRLCREWQRCFGAELVANWGTMLQFVAASPPTTLTEAFDLALQQVAVAPCTTALPTEPVRELARHLWRGDRWFLHERP